MPLFIDKKYVSLISTKLDRFQQKSEFLWQFRCPVCGDSHKNKFKARGYFYRKKNDLFFACHNCGAGASIGNFIKMMDKNLYNEYRLESFVESGKKLTPAKEPDMAEFLSSSPVFKKIDINLPSIESLPQDHFARQFVADRQIPRQFWSDLYYAKDFKIFVHELLPKTDKKLSDRDERLIIPFRDEKGSLLGFQGRSLSTSMVKYITVKMDDTARKIFGLDRVDATKTIYVFEGPLDSMFIDNSLANMDGALHQMILKYGPADYVFCYDNEPRNPEVVNNIQRTIDMGQKVCIWPRTMKEKDINDLILSGYTKERVKELIDRNTFSEARAKLQFIQWKKI